MEKNPKKLLSLGKELVKKMFVRIIFLIRIIFRIIFSIKCALWLFGIIGCFSGPVYLIAYSSEYFPHFTLPSNSYF